MPKVLLVRMDRLGDLVCTLPVDQDPHLQGAHCQCSWLISKGLEPVLELSVPPRTGWSESTAFSWPNFLQLVRRLRAERFQKVIFFFGPWWVALACFCARIPERFSPRSRWFQFLFFNKTLRQHRSRSDKHEADYNAELVRWALTGQIETTVTPPFLTLESNTAPPTTLPVRYVVIHPGMGGSALNWPTKYYFELALDFIAKGFSVVITGTEADRVWLKDIEAHLSANSKVTWLVGKLDLKALIYVLSKSEATIAPSTGVVHLAASTGVKTIGIYSPIKVQTPVRWGPRGHKAKALTPNVHCPASRRCQGERCPSHFCLAQIKPLDVIRATEGL